MSIVTAYQRLQKVSSIVISDRLVFETPADYIRDCINATQRRLHLRPLSDVQAQAFWTDRSTRKRKLPGSMGFQGDPNIWWSMYHTHDTPNARYQVTKVRSDADKAIARFRHLGKNVHIVSPEVDSIIRAQIALVDENLTCWSVSNGEPLGGGFDVGSLGAILSKDGCYDRPDRVAVIGSTSEFALAAYSRNVGFIYFKTGEGDIAVSMFADAGEVGRWDHIFLAFSTSD